MLRKAILGALAFVILVVLASFAFGEATTATAQGSQVATADDFIRQVAPWAQAEQLDSSVPASFSIAEAMHESGCRSNTNCRVSLLASKYNNYHGIKCSQPSEGLPCITLENASWDQYSSGANGFLWHGRWLRGNGNYRNAFNYANDPFAFAREVLRCYTGCGEPFPQSYYDSIVSFINNYNLRQYESTSPVSPPRPSLPPIVQKPVDDLLKQINEKLEDLQTQLRREVEKYIQREIDRIIRETCGIPGAVLMLATLVAVNHKRKT